MAKQLGFLVVMAAFLVGCGGGGENPPDPVVPPIADTQLDWDDDNWDERNWQ